jgi:hypothetical protein
MLRKSQQRKKFGLDSVQTNLDTFGKDLTVLDTILTGLEKIFDSFVKRF